MHYISLKCPAYPISLYSTGVVTFDDVNKCESLWKVLLNYVIHDGRFANSWTVDYYDIFLKDVTNKILNMKAIFASIFSLEIPYRPEFF